jgi:hypothetical protein
MLTFEDQDAAARYLEYLKMKGDLTSVEKKHDNFTSKRAYLEDQYTQGQYFYKSNNPDSTQAAQHSRDEFVHRSDFPASDEFLSILNANGKVQIANRIFKVTENYVYEADQGELSVLEEVDGSQKEHSQLNVHKVQHSTVGATTDDGTQDTCTRYSTDDFRMRAASGFYNYWFFAEAVVQTQWQEETGWWFFVDWDNVCCGDFDHSWIADIYVRGIGGSDYVKRSGADSGSGSEKETQIYYEFGWGVLLSGDINTDHSMNNATFSGSCDTEV